MIVAGNACNDQAAIDLVRLLENDIGGGAYVIESGSRLADDIALATAAVQAPLPEFQHPLRFWTKPLLLATDEK